MAVDCEAPAHVRVARQTEARIGAEPVHRAMRDAQRHAIHRLLARNENDPPAMLPKNAPRLAEIGQLAHGVVRKFRARAVGRGAELHRTGSDDAHRDRGAHARLAAGVEEQQAHEEEARERERRAADLIATGGEARHGRGHAVQRSAERVLMMAASPRLGAQLEHAFDWTQRAQSDGLRHFACLANAITNASFLVTHNNHCTESEAASAFHYLGNPFDGYDPLFQVNFTCFYSFNVCLRHTLEF